MTKLFVEGLKEWYEILDNAIQNSDHTDFEQCYSALAELCERALCGLDKYKGVASVPDRIKMFKRDMNYVQGLRARRRRKLTLMMR